MLLLGVFQLWESIGAEDQVVVLMRFWEAKVAMLITCVFLFVLSCAGFTFIGKKRRCSGMCLLFLTLGGLAWQVYAFAHLYANENSLEKFDEWFGSDLSNHEGLDEFLTISRNNTMKNWYMTFHESMTHWECEVSDDPSDALRRTSSVFFTGGESGVVSVAEDTPTDRCDKPKLVECDEKPEYADWTADFCIPPSNGGVSECTNCLADFFDDFVSPASSIDDATMTEYRTGFAGDVGTLFCRCMPAVLALTEWWTRTILITTLVYIVVEVLFLLAVMWLIMCGPDAPTEEEQMQIEMDALVKDPQDGSELVQVICPYDAGPGQMVMVRFGDREKKVRVPAGVFAGMPFQARV